MIIISKPKLLGLFLVSLFYFIPIIGIAHGLYVSNLPSNVIFADDFENYTQGQNLGACGGAPQGGGGWSYNDGCPAGYVSDINNTGYYSCCKSLYVQSPNAGNAVGDIEKKLGIPSNSTTTIQFSSWTAVGGGYTTHTNNNAHISLETWGTKNAANGPLTDRYEAVVYLYSRATTNPDCATIPGIEPDVFTTLTGSSGDHNVGYCLLMYDKNTNAQGGNAYGVWHHITITANIITMNWVALEIDGVNLNSVVSGLSMNPHSLCTQNSGCVTNDLSHQNFNTKNFLIEFGALNMATHTLPTDTWWAWHDDVVVSDVTSSAPCGPLCLSAVNLSAWFGILMITVGAGTSSSLYFGAARMLRGEPFKSKEVVALMFAGVLGVLAFGVMMAVAVGLIKIIPGG